DECFTDSNCPSGAPCICRTSASDDSANICATGGNCVLDSDCGPGGFCSPSEWSSSTAASFCSTCPSWPASSVPTARITSRPSSRGAQWSLLERLDQPFRLTAELLYGSGLRLLECLSIRVKDVDLERHQIMVRRGKGEKDRAALLPARVRPDLAAQLA